MIIIGYRYVIGDQCYQRALVDTEGEWLAFSCRQLGITRVSLGLID